jgi:very-short-patch-repair endonuclease
VVARKSVQQMAKEAWRLARAQHFVITRRQLIGIGYTSEAIDWRIADGRLFPLHAGVYAVGRPQLTREGVFIAAVLACGPEAVLSHESAAELWGILKRHRGPIHVTVPEAANPRRPGIAVHRRAGLQPTRRQGIAVTTPIDTLVDVAPRLSEAQLERAINEAVNRDLTDPDELRAAAAQMRRRRGARKVLRLLDRATYVVTDSRLEQQFLRIVRAAGLPMPQTQRHLGGGRVDFYWPELGLVVEADSLRFHRTPFQQRTDLLRDQKHAVAELERLRFTHFQVMKEPDHVAATLTAIIRRLEAKAA